LRVKRTLGKSLGSVSRLTRHYGVSRLTLYGVARRDKRAKSSAPIDKGSRNEL
jgi:hypothetical protein